MTEAPASVASTPAGVLKAVPPQNSFVLGTMARGGSPSYPLPVHGVPQPAILTTQTEEQAELRALGAIYKVAIPPLGERDR